LMTPSSTLAADASAPSTTTEPAAEVA
jgi:hypothetical protein